MPPRNPWIPVQPTPKQAEFLAYWGQEALFGGAAGGGKSIALLAGALQFVDISSYRALILRRSLTDLSLPGGLIDRAREWLSPTPAKWNGDERTWVFPSGAMLSFGYLDNAGDKYRYQSTEFSFIAFDELTQFEEADYLYLFSRLRRLATAEVPLRVRAASNPGGRGHNWVEQRFLIEGPAKGRAYFPSRVKDNPHLDYDAYVASLSELDWITRRQLLEGDWSARNAGTLFKREWLRLDDTAPTIVQAVRSWDLAATEAKPGSDPDYCVGTLLGRAADGSFWILDIRRVRASPQQVEALVMNTAREDGVSVALVMEQEGGSSGKMLAAHFATRLAGYIFHPQRVTGDKVARASPVSSQCEAGNFHALRRAWTTDLLNELESFPAAGHDDQVDALSLGFGYLCAGRPVLAPFETVPQAAVPREQLARGLGAVLAHDPAAVSHAIFGRNGRPDLRGARGSNGTMPGLFGRRFGRR